MAAIGTSRRGLHARSDLPMNAEINVTSLVDVAFTLLVIFIITAPILQGGIEVAVPRADVPPLTAEQDPLYVSILREGTILLEETPVTPEELQASLPQVLAAGGVGRVFVRADSLAPYGPVLKAIAAVKNSGVNMALVGEPFTGGR